MTNPTPQSFDVRAIANALLIKAENREPPLKLTAMQLIKLVYLVHGWSLAYRNTPIVNNRPQAWQFGPVYPHIYKKVKKMGDSPIAFKLEDADGNVYYPHGITQGDENLLDDILQSYGDLKAFRLSAITHEEGTPWDYTRKNLGQYQEIPEDEMRSHFETLSQKRNIDLTRYTAS